MVSFPSWIARSNQVGTNATAKPPDYIALIRQQEIIFPRGNIMAGNSLGY